MNVARHLINVLIMAVFLVGCNPVNVTDISTSTPSQYSQSIPTTTILPTSTPIPSATPDITQTAFAQEILSAQFIEQTLVAQYPSICENLISSRDFSPNGLWMVEFCYIEDEKSLILAISKKESQSLWKLHYRDYIAVTDFVPDGGLSVVLWSNDNQHVYFNSYVNTSGGECFVRGNVAESGLGLFRLNLNTGNITTILPPKDNFGWYVYIFSSTGEQLIYGAYAHDFKILDINSGELLSINPVINFSEGGGFLWSPDGSELVYSTVLYNEISEPVDYSLRLVDAQSGGEKILLESPKDCFNTLSWTEDNILKVEKDFGNTIIEFDLNANKIINETTTP